MSLTGKITYTFSAALWQHQAITGGWYFLSLPNELSEEIRTHLGWQEEGWGRLKVRARINQTEWDTAIWFDTKLQTYLLPVKATVRKKEKLEPKQIVSVILNV